MSSKRAKPKRKSEIKFARKANLETKKRKGQNNEGTSAQIATRRKSERESERERERERERGRERQREIEREGEKERERERERERSSERKKS